MLTPENKLLELIQSNAFFSKINEVDRARIIASGQAVSYEAQTVIFKENEEAKFLYIILDGTVDVSDAGNIITKSEGDLIGRDAFFSAPSCNENAVAQTNVTLYQIPKETIENITAHQPNLFNLFYWVDKKKESPYSDTAQEDGPSSLKPVKTIVGWILALLAPVLAYHLIGDALPFSSRIFVSAFMSCIVLWTFNVTYEFVPGLLIIICSLTLGIVPSNIALSGFISDTYLLILSLSGVAAVIVSSGILYRLLAVILNYLPIKSSWHVLGLFSLGMAMTPIIPSIVNRTRLVSTMVSDIIGILNVKKRSVLASKLAAAAYAGTSCLSSVLVTGSIMNFTALGLLPLQERIQIASIGWTFAALIPTIVLTLTNLFGLSLFFHTTEKVQLTKTLAQTHVNALGPLRKSEWEAILSILFFVTALILFPSQQINIAILSLFLFFAVTALGILSIPNWVARTDWSFLLFIGTVVSIANCFKYFQLNTILGNLLNPLFHQTSSHYVIISAFIACILLVRLIMPIGPTFVLMMSIAFSISDFYGINIWLLTFVILLIGDVWFFAYQAPFYRSFKEEFKGPLPYDERSFLLYNGLNNVARIISIFLSIPFWKYIGLI